LDDNSIPKDCDVNGPDTFEFIAYCDTENDKNDQVVWKPIENGDACKIQYESTSTAGCRTDLKAMIKPVLNFGGSIMIVLGLALVFYGARLFPWVLGG